MTELSMGEGKSKTARYISTGLYISVLVTTIVFNGLAGPGAAPFNRSTGEISNDHYTCITPAGYTFAIWGVIYFLLTCIAIYSLYILFRKVGFDSSWQLGGAVSVPFLLMLSLNLALNISWLFAWNAEDMVASFVVILFVAVTNIIAIFLTGYSFMRAAPKLYEYSKFDFWMGIFVMNSHCIYVVWTLLASLINLGIMVSELNDQDGAVQNISCIAILSILLAGFILYFIIEQVFLKKIANPLFTHYLVYAWASIGIYIGNDDYASDAVLDLIIANISNAVGLLLLRSVFLFFRNRKNGVYKEI